MDGERDIRCFLKLPIVLVASFVVCSCVFLTEPVTSSFVKYKVHQGDTLFAIAKRFGSSEKEILAYNEIEDPRRLIPGRILFFPWRGADDMAAARASTGGGTIRPDRVAVNTVKLTNARKYVGGMKWPVKGAPISSTFGTRWSNFHEGLDLVAEEGASVSAAHSGIVAYSGNGISGYGNLVVLKGDGILSIYAHNDRNVVRYGEEVSRGEKIAEVGKTGHATGPHLHFEVRVKNRDGKFVAVDPLVFYPQ